MSLSERYRKSRPRVKDEWGGPNLIANLERASKIKWGKSGARQEFPARASIVVEREIAPVHELDLVEHGRRDTPLAAEGVVNGGVAGF